MWGERNTGKDIVTHLGVMLVSFLIFILYVQIVDRNPSVETKNHSESNIVKSKGLTKCLKTLPKQYVECFGIVDDMKIGDTAWTCYLLLDSSNNTWVRKDAEITREKESFNDIMVIRDSFGYLIDLRFCDNKKFRVSDYSLERCEQLGFLVYGVFVYY